MKFPEYKLGQYQAQWNAKVRRKMCAAALSPPSMADIFSLATEKELTEWNSLPLSYADERGDADLRELIAQNYPSLTAENIVTFCGTQEALFCAMQATISPNDNVASIDPNYEPLIKLPAYFGATVRATSLQKVMVADNVISHKNENSFLKWKLPIEEFLNNISQGAQHVIINFPHNPTGCLIDSVAQQQIINSAAKNNAWLFSDEVFRGLEHNKDDQLAPIASLYEKGISLGSIGKPFGLGGVRIGWIACKNKELLNNVVNIKRSLSICTGRADEWLAKIVLQNSHLLLDATRALLNEHISIIEKDLLPLNNFFEWIKPQAGCIAFPSLTLKAKAELFSERLVNNRAILIIPGICFSDKTLYQSHFRLGFGLKDFPETWHQFVNFITQ